MVRTIVSQYSDLKKACVSVEKNENVSAIIKDLKDTLDPKKGYALAANQIGYDKRIFFFKLAKKIDPRTKEVEYEELAVINPEIIARDDKIINYREGCMSFPSLRVDTDRYNFITVRFENEKREQSTAVMQNLESMIWQHEIDHLNGLLIMDRKHKAR